MENRIKHEWKSVLTELLVYLHGKSLKVVDTLESLWCEVVDAVLAAQAG